MAARPGSISPQCNASGPATLTTLLAGADSSWDGPSYMQRDVASGNHSVGYVRYPFWNREGKHDANTHHDRWYSCASCCTCSFVAARMRRRIVSCETPYAAATVRSGSFFSTTRCTTVGQWEAGIPYAGCFGPARQCFITTGGVLPAAVSSSERRC